MNHKSHGVRSTFRSAAVLAGVTLAWAGAAFEASAQSTDLANTPLITASPSSVKPNIMFILDDSGSMGWDFMPDDANFATGKYGFYAAQCNGLAYNPSITYSVPVDANGNNLADGTYTFPTPGTLPNQRTVWSAAPSLGTGSVTVTVDDFGQWDYTVGDLITIYSSTDETRWMVGTITGVDDGANTVTINVTEFNGTGTLASARVGDRDFRPFYYSYNTYTGAPVALAYTYPSGSLDTTTTFFRECDSLVGASPGNGRFTKVSVTTANITQNYRNWYTYYRTRMLTMRTAVSQAFKNINNDYRVGFSTISSTTVDGSEFLDITDFDATQKTTWYSRLFGSNPGGSTPLRGAVSHAGKYFAKKGVLSSGAAQTYDPLQLSCQKNFAILTTDGYWNTGLETATHGPYKLDGTTVGQQDATAARPMRDASTTTLQTRTSLLQQRSVATQLQSATTTLQTRTGTLQTRTSGNSGGSWSGWTNTTSCTWDTTGSSRRQCQYVWNNWTDATATCNVVTASTGGGTWSQASPRECRYSTPTWTNVGSCTPSSPAPSAGPTSYSTLSATLCQTQTTYGSWTNVGSCTASATNECQYTAWTAWSTAASCTAAAQSTAPNYTVSTARECSNTSTGGSLDSLADIAMYYYETDLRTPALGNCALANGSDGCTNNVRPRGVDNAEHQHMTTFTLGMGVSGTLGYHPNYIGGQSPDFQEIIAGTKNWPNAGDNWGAVNIDDLWHAAVNGRGQYFSAGDPNVLARSLNDTLVAIDARNGTAAAAATSTLQPVPGDNTEFVTSYTTISWVGDVVAYQVDPRTGVRSTTAEWSARQRLDARVAAGTARNIYYTQRSAGSNSGTLREFNFSNLNSDGFGANFTNVCSKTPALAQCTSTGYDISGANQGNNMVNWLRGQSDSRYRSRQHILGDIVGGAPVFLGKPPFSYTENNYQTFVSTLNASNSGAGRKGVVYVPSNGGMLHAFEASTGQELWAYVPSMVMDRMYRLADVDYATKHEYFVNATPVIGDIWVPGSGITPGTWKTILVGGLGAGGRGYYALDITNPDAPQALWEFTNDSRGGNDNLGLTFGNPLITKRADGRWVVIFTSGYNNVTPGDGNGRLFVVDANTGDRLSQIQTYTSGTTPAGSSTTPSGLAKIAGWVESQRDNTVLRVYGGDLLGNLWRFDIDGLVAPNNAALRLAALSAGSPAVAQPITTRPELASVTSGGTTYPVVYVGTGKMLGLSDLTINNQQSIYAIKDPMTNTPLGNPRSRTDFVQQTLTVDSTTRARSVSNNAVDWATKSGWYVDLPAAGERVNIDVRLALTTLVVATNAPSSNICAEGGGSSYLYLFDFTTGSSQPNANGVVGISLGDSYAVGVGAMQLYSDTLGAGRGGATARIQMGDGSVRQTGMYTPATANVSGRRTSWRELID